VVPVFFLSFFLQNIIFPLLPWVFSFMKSNGESFYSTILPCCLYLPLILFPHSSIAHYFFFRNFLTVNDYNKLWILFNAVSILTFFSKKGL
jgi:hypothetical protein